jgi:hypothetical protein
MKIEEEVIGEQGLAALALGKFEGVYEIEGGLLDTWVGFLAPFFGLRFSVDFSPLFGLRAFGKLLVLLYFSSFEVDLGPVFGPLLDRTFHQRCHLSGLHEAGFQV